MKLTSIPTITGTLLTAVLLGVWSATVRKPYSSTFEDRKLPAPTRMGTSLDWRVSKGTGRGDSLRFSLISKNPPAATFDYMAQFQHKWSQFHLSTSLLLDVGESTSFSALGEQITVRLPPPSEGIKILMFSDPCLTGAPKVACPYPEGEAEKRFPAILNAAASSIDAWGILGDNFYDEKGDTTFNFFSDLGFELKSKVFFTVPGNHDYWIRGDPKVRIDEDQLGYGFMQFYGQDTVARINKMPFNFNHNASTGEVATQDNFNWYYQLSNVGLIGFTGVGDLQKTHAFIQTACASFTISRPAFIYIIGHWVKSIEYGAPVGMGTEDIHAYAVSQDGCNRDNVKFIVGHYHCNTKYGTKGFQIGHAGAGSGIPGMCTDMGFMYLETQGDIETVTYFTVYDNGSGMSSDNATDNAPLLEKCFRQRGIDQCKHLGTSWS